MSTNNHLNDLPTFLRTFEDLLTHFDEHFGELGTNEKGDTFLNLARQIIPLTEMGQPFPVPTLNPKKSHDNGIDLFTAQNPHGIALCAQSKYKIRSKDELDSIISKFKNFEAQLVSSEADAQAALFPSASNATGTEPLFFIVTGSKLDDILARYKKTSLASVDYYNDLVKAGRICIIDGPRILTILQQIYRKTHGGFRNSCGRPGSRLVRRAALGHDRPTCETETSTRSSLASRPRGTCAMLILGSKRKRSRFSSLWTRA